MDEAVVLSHMKEAACSSWSSRSASVKADGAWKSLQKRLRPWGNPRKRFCNDFQASAALTLTQTLMNDSNKPLPSCGIRIDGLHHHFQQLLRPLQIMNTIFASRFNAIHLQTDKNGYAFWCAPVEFVFLYSKVICNARIKRCADRRNTFLLCCDFLGYSNDTELNGDANPAGTDDEL